MPRLLPHHPPFPNRARIRSVGRPITHIVDFQGRAEGDVGQSREAAPHDDVAGRRILGTVEIAAEPGAIRIVHTLSPSRACPAQ